MCFAWLNRNYMQGAECVYLVCLQAALTWYCLLLPPNITSVALHIIFLCFLLHYLYLLLWSNYCGWNEAKSRTDCIKCVAFLWQNIFLHRPTWLSVSDMQFTKWAWADLLKRFIIFPKVVSSVCIEVLMNRAYWEQAWGSWILSGQIKTA